MGDVLKFFVPGPLPGRNEQEAAARKHRMAAAALKKKWTNHVTLCCSGTGKTFNRVHVDFIWYQPNKRMDPDNVAGGGMKICFDGLQGAGVIPNDGWKNIESFSHTFQVNKESPGVAMVITEVK